jgi:hypothetical protein
MLWDFFIYPLCWIYSSYVTVTTNALFVPFMSLICFLICRRQATNSQTLPYKTAAIYFNAEKSGLISPLLLKFNVHHFGR